MANRKDIIELHKKQLKLEINAIRLAIQHKAAKGSEAELTFKRLIRKYLPQRYQLGSGFVINEDKISNQHDIIVYDDFMNAPLYLGDNFGSFFGGAVYGVLETTISKLNKGKLEEDIKKNAYLRKIFPGDKVAFQKVESRPIVKEEELRRHVENCLSTGYSIDDVWPEIKEKCISKEGAFVGDIFGINSLMECDRESISDEIIKLSRRAQKFIVADRTIYSTPPPRTYICALDGTSYKSIKTLSKVLKRLTKKHGAHIHGLLVLNREGGDWLLSTKAYSNYDVEVQTKDAFFHFLENMKRDFQGMLIGKYPAGDTKS